MNTLGDHFIYWRTRNVKAMDMDDDDGHGQGIEAVENLDILDGDDGHGLGDVDMDVEEGGSADDGGNDGDTFGEGDELKVRAGDLVVAAYHDDWYIGLVQGENECMYQAKSSNTFKWPNVPDEQQIPKRQILKTGVDAFIQS